MELSQLLAIVDLQHFFPYAFKILAVIFSVFYLLYAVVIYRQTAVMNQTFTVKNNFIISSISVLQIVAGVILTLLAILFV